MTAAQWNGLRERLRGQFSAETRRKRLSLPASAGTRHDDRLLREVVAQALSDRPVACIRGQEPVADQRLALILR